ncbi:MAG TPA: hypothetical protein VGT44_20320, partial [Ktedonobacteraceae bacterium]|nr:hypothetical protein [Ktedonobacteraceae bacterium]
MTERLQIRVSRVIRARLCWCAIASLLVLTRLGATREKGGAADDQGREYAAEAPKTILELQQFRQSHSIQIRSKGGRQGAATLVDLNPAINVWYLLKVVWKDGGPELAYHLENPKPHARKLLLDEKYSAGLVVAEGKNRYFCDLFGADALGQAKATGLIFSPMCEGHVYLRNPATGHRTNLEAATELLRQHVWGAEKIIALGHILMGDVHRETGKIQTAAGAKTGREAG